MLTRRTLFAGLALAPALPATAAAQDYAAFLADLRARAASAGIPAAVITQALAPLTQPNPAVLKLDQHQPEFTETWATYSSHVLSAARITNGQAKYISTQSLLAAISARFGIPAEALLGIWGLETNYGASQGDFNIIDALATLAWDRQSRFFGTQAIDAMHIIANNEAPAAGLTGSYAGAMGQPQFMPSVYLSTAISYAGGGAPDIWHSDADSLASMANYLAQAGWRPGEPSSEPVYANISPALATGRKIIRTLGYWQNFGVQRLPGATPLPETFPAALLLPDGSGGQAFLIYANFAAIRRYNPSDYYALATAALGRAILA